MYRNSLCYLAYSDSLYQRGAISPDLRANTLQHADNLLPDLASIHTFHSTYNMPLRKPYIDQPHVGCQYGDRYYLTSDDSGNQKDFVDILQINIGGFRRIAAALLRSVYNGLLFVVVSLEHNNVDMWCFEP